MACRFLPYGQTTRSFFSPVWTSVLNSQKKLFSFRSMDFTTWFSTEKLCIRDLVCYILQLSHVPYRMMGLALLLYVFQLLPHYTVWNTVYCPFVSLTLSTKFHLCNSVYSLSSCKICSEPYLILSMSQSPHLNSTHCYLNKGTPTRWHLLYYVNLLLNMFQMLIHPSSGACDCLLCCCVGCNDRGFCVITAYTTMQQVVASSWRWLY